jgi:hypothetical protein
MGMRMDDLFFKSSCPPQVCPQEDSPPGRNRAPIIEGKPKLNPISTVFQEAFSCCRPHFNIAHNQVVILYFVSGELKINMVIPEFGEVIFAARKNLLLQFDKKQGCQELKLMPGDL